MDDAIIRPRRDSDLPGLAEILLEVHEQDGYPVEGVADPVGWLTPAHPIAAFVIELDGEAVGHAALSRPGSGDTASLMWSEQSGHPRAQTAVVERVFVAPRARGRRFGRLLTQAASRVAQRAGLTPVLDVMLKDAAAIHTYETLGWTSLGDFRYLHGDGGSEPARAYFLPSTPAASQQAGDSQSPVYSLIKEVEAAVHGGAWTLALMGIVAIPDICSALETENGWATRDKYVNWWNKYLRAHYPALDASEFYQIRNSMLHTGNTRAKGYDRVIFPAPSGYMLDGNIINDAVQLDLPALFQRVADAVYEWRTGEGNTEITRINEARMVQWYRNGLPPYLVGLDVLT